MNLLYIFSLVTGIVECLFFSGLIFGWGSIRYVLEKEGYFSNYCSVENITETPVVTNSTDEYSVTTVAPKNSTELEHNDGYPTCDKQSEQFILVFIIASASLSLLSLPNGFLFDKCGTWISRVLAILLFTLACVLIGVSSIESSWLLFPAMSCFAVGGILFLLTNMQVGNLFGRMRNSVITLFNGALDSSSFVFLLVKISYDNGFVFKDVILFIAFCTIFLWLRTFLFLPKMHIPFPLPKTGVKLGLKDCKSEKKYVSNELKKIKSDETEQLAEVKDTNENGNNHNGLSDSNCASEEHLKNKEITYVDCIKSSLFWSNCLHFSMLQLRNYFFLSTIYDWLSSLPCGSDNCDSTVSEYLNVFGACQFFGVMFAPLNGMLIDFIAKHYKHSVPSLTPLIAVMWSAVITTLLATLFSIFVAIPILKAQYISFILQVIFRSFLYGGNASFLAVAFPSKHFGKLYGLTMTVGGVASLLQFPLFSLVMNAFDGSFFVINIFFIFFCFAMLIHPLHVYLYCKKKAKITKNGLTNGNGVIEENIIT